MATMYCKLVGLCVLFILITGCKQKVAPPPTSTTPTTFPALPALTDTPYILGVSTPNPYTDEQAESFLDRLPSVESQIELEEDPPRIDNPRRNALVLDALGIDISRLRKWDAQVGDCTEWYSYELSPSYILYINNNACYPGGLSIGTKQQYCEAVLFAVGCDDTAPSPTRTVSLSEVPGKRWVDIDPVQCLGNPWEIDWLQSNDNGSNHSYDDYPIGDHYVIEEPEARIIKRYYEKQRIQVAEVKSVSFEQKYGEFPELCEACDCPQGYTLYLLIPDYQVDAMLALGYKVHQ